ncbi:MAG TPA: hypothetical protein VF529_02730 [Solirubrobacteraceae bacterium]
MTRALISISAAGAAALALAACGGGDGGGGDTPASPRERAQESALEFARCMREQGVDFPDPQVGENGLVMIGPGPGKGPRPDDPKLRRATEACEEHLDAGGEAPDDAVLAKHRDAFVAYARCMREEGVNVPDPGAEGGLVFKVGDPDAPDPRSPAYRRADEVCHKHLAAVDAELEQDGQG